jgi:hypothetical protein
VTGIRACRFCTHGGIPAVQCEPVANIGRTRHFGQVPLFLHGNGAASKRLILGPNYVFKPRLSLLE